MTLSLVYILENKIQQLDTLSSLALEIYPSRSEFYILNAYAMKRTNPRNTKVQNFLTQAQLLDFDNNYKNIINLMKGSTTEYKHLNTFTLIIAIETCNLECLEKIKNNLKLSSPVNYYIAYIIDSKLGNKTEAGIFKLYLEKNSLLNKKCDE
jgi:hypothetical protein